MTQADAERLLGFAIEPGWTFHVIRRGGVMAGFVMQRDSEVHVCRAPEYAGRWFTRGDIERVLLPILRNHGEVTTRVRADNLTGQRFVRRLGFVPAGELPGIHLFRASRFNHARL